MLFPRVEWCDIPGGILLVRGRRSQIDVNLANRADRDRLCWGRSCDSNRWKDAVFIFFFKFLGQLLNGTTSGRFNS